MNENIGIIKISKIAGTQRNSNNAPVKENL